MTTPDRRIAFLTYLSRSGSTFLAQRLHALRDVGVSLEARIPDDLVYGPVDVHAEADRVALVDHLFTDEKFRAWGIDRARLDERLASLPLPLGFGDLLPALLDLHLGAPEPAVRVYKMGHYVFHLDVLRRWFPDCRVIFVLRDPRGVYNSQKRARDSRTGQPMAVQPVDTALRFRQAAEALDRHRTAPWLHIVRYEQLVAEPDAECERIAAFLGVQSEPDPEAPLYDEQIPAAQQHLHPHAGGAPIAQRSDAWREELHPSEIFCLQRLAGPAMERWRYPLIQPGGSALARWTGYAAYRARHRLRDLRHRLRAHRTNGDVPQRP
ncbi:MAG: sulfotransferase family protein [Planctomycetota bacterium]